MFQGFVSSTGRTSWNSTDLVDLIEYYNDHERKRKQQPTKTIRH